ncbi:FolC bifunctional protein [Gloeobacter kilaueensis JS1]|uniref:tetrahydrofolate synthase n=1 Tax=Gloeobacter kilaueensis (strain ATCC BAA-2537 / CCAP 1431/1 / ULC 316 / JS1) TaxID=1183438 RepID=U5QJG5_GLOK1|nr:FolC bifunctional protein [Gloeobacter kilaueensis JS1]
MAGVFSFDPAAVCRCAQDAAFRLEEDRPCLVPTVIDQPYLDSLQIFGIHLGLERIRALLDALGNPQNAFEVIHVAGTNGKGSVCAYLSAILQAAGLRTGRYTSPHLVRWNERIWLDGHWIEDGPLDACLSEVQAATALLADALGPPTQFEVMTAAALLHFARAKVQVAVVEVGLGGRLDATNVFDRPLVSVITGIGLDHCAQLGDTAAAIAAEKAGILRPGVPLVCAPVEPEAERVICERAAALAVPVTVAHPAQEAAPGEAVWEGFRYRLPLAGAVQLQNSATALAVCRVLTQRGLAIGEQALRQGLARTHWPGRYQWQQEQLLLDGAHNPQAAVHLRHYLDAIRPGEPVRWIVGILKSKDARSMLTALLRPGDRLLAVPVPDSDSYPPAELVAMARSLGIEAREASNTGEALTGPWEYLSVIAGSLYLIGAHLGAGAPQTSN